MFKKHEIKLQALVVAGLFFLVAEGVYADSAVNSGAILTPGTSKANQSFLLDSGTMNFLPTGTQWIGGDTGGAGCTTGCAGGTNYKGVCPKGFIPYIVTSPFKSGTLQTSTSSGSIGVNAICPTNFNMSAGGNYQIGFGFTSLTTATTGAVDISGSAFNWYIYCIPGSYTNSYGPNQWTTNGTTPGYGVSNWVPGCTSCSDSTPQCCAGTSATSLCSAGSLAPSGTGTTLTPIVWETGTWDHVLVPISSFPIQTTKLCPQGYSPEIEVTPYKGIVSNAGTNTEASKLFICPLANTLSPTNPNFTVNGSGYQINLAGSTQNAVSTVGAKWTLTCYPPGNSPPPLGDCSLPAQVEQKWSQVFKLGNHPAFWGGQGNSVPGTGTGDIIGGIAQMWPPANTSWPIAFQQSNVVGGSGNWSWPFQFYIPFSGTYDLLLNFTLIGVTNQANHTCMYFFVNVNDTLAAFFDSEAVVPNAVGNINGVLHYGARALNVHVNANDKITILGDRRGFGTTEGPYTCNPGTVILTSNGDVTAVRTGP